MPRKSTTQTSHERLEQAIALLIQVQVAYVSRVDKTSHDHAELERRYLDLKRESDARFARIEAQMAEILRILNQHTRLLNRMTEDICELIGAIVQ